MFRTTFLSCVVGLSSLLVPSWAHGQIASPLMPNLVRNGSFEQNNATATIFCLWNDQFNASVRHVTAFGPVNCTHLIHAVNQPFGLPPVHGNWKAAISHGMGAFDWGGVSFALTEPIQEGVRYRVTFRAYAEISANSPGNEPLVAGVSVQAHLPGEVVYTTPALSTNPGAGWALYTSEFIAPNDAEFLTLTIQGAIPGLPTQAHIDQVVLRRVPELVTRQPAPIPHP